MNFVVRACEPQELPKLIERLDQEFIFNKQRTLSLGPRFPNTLSLENIEQIRVAVSDGVIYGAHSIRFFDWLADKKTWRGAMIGVVWVDSQQRGKGIASDLLTSASQFLKRNNVDFGVLWTGTPKVYERFGWFLNDCGLFSEVTNKPLSPCSGRVTCQPLVSVDKVLLERLRADSIPMRVTRNLTDYQTVPIPADRVLCFSVQNVDESEGFALVGEHSGNCYLYEMVAPPILWRTILYSIANRFDRVFVNGYSGEPFTQWLAENGYVQWRAQKKAMWLPLSKQAESCSFNNWHIPYFDWI